MKDFFSQTVQARKLANRMLVGGIIALAFIIFFLLQVKNPQPEWGNKWIVKPLIMVPLAGAVGGLVYFFLEYFQKMGGWKKALAIIASIIIYVVGLWMGLVIGLDGTLWN